MKNIPRIYLNENIESGQTYPLPIAVAHYLTRVMRTDKCMVFNNGAEFVATIVPGKKNTDAVIVIDGPTNRPDPSNELTLAFAPIKSARTEELVNMATQMGVRDIIPVITERTTSHHINWDRARKIAAEAAEQSNRNSVPEIHAPVKFDDFIKKTPNIIFADERFAHKSMPDPDISNTDKDNTIILIGPEGGFSDTEFAALDTAGAIGINLGETVLRAETAAVAAITMFKVQSSKCN